MAPARKVCESLVSWRQRSTQARRLAVARLKNISQRLWSADLQVWILGKLLTLLRAFPPNEPTKKRFVSEMVAWSGKAGDYPNGDPELHHVAGTLFAEGIKPPA